MKKVNLAFFEIAGVLVRRDHVASFIVNANRSVVRTAEKLAYAIALLIAFVLGVTQRAEREHIGD